MKPLGDSLYECVYLKGHPALTTSNSDNPPGSFHSKDVFTPHPTIPDRWKYASRLDDRITLVNGEKVLPLPIEGYVKQDYRIHEAVVVGLGKAAPGLLVWRSGETEAACVSDEEYLDEIWSTIEAANSRTERFSQISRDMIAALPYASKFPRTDKGSMIRAQVYAHYADLIDTLYARAERLEGSLRMHLAETQSLLMKLCHEELGIPLSGVEANFYAEGIDSLKAIHLRRLILQNFQLPEAINHNVVYEAGSVACLAEHICALQTGEATRAVKSDTEVMARLIQKYSSFQQHIPRPERFPGTNGVVSLSAVSQFSAHTDTVQILTGATGSLGAHILYELLNDSSITTVFCLTRRSSPVEATLRSLFDRGLYIGPEQACKIIALNSTLEQPNLGLEKSLIRCMQDSVTQIIHAAWPVNFNLPLPQFDPHIQGLHNLIQFSLSVRQPHPATLMFCSSISTALASSSTIISETPMTLDSAYMGYGQSKLIGEHIISAAHRQGARAYTLRIGQISGHSKKGLWNDKEALPLLIRSVLTLKTLPALDQTCSWLPVDKLASTVVDLTKSCSGSMTESFTISNECYTIDPSHSPGHMDTTSDKSEDGSIYNICNSREFTWSALLTLLRTNGFQFETVPFEEWLQMLRESEARGEEHVNPAVKLIGHYEAMYGPRFGTNDVGPGSCLAPKVFITDKAERDSVTLRNGRLRIIEDGILNCYVRDWLRRWMTS